VSGQPLLRALVVEDEWLARNYLVELLQASGMADVVAAVTNTSEAEQALEDDSTRIDAAFVDIQLAGRPGDDSGLAWVRKWARVPGAPRLVLATALRQHALEAFELGVADYLLKPFTGERVDECLRRLLAQPTPSPGPLPSSGRIVARRGRALVFLNLDEVWACEASERLTYVHSARGRFALDLTLNATGASFGRALVRVHRNWLVNLARVLELERDSGDASLLVGNAEATLRVPISRDRAQAVRELLMNDATGVRRF
jgi:two-component system response regulator LytT